MLSIVEQYFITGRIKYFLLYLISLSRIISYQLEGVKNIHRKQKMKRTDKAEKISITLPPDMLNIIREKVKDGAYASTSEVIREAMRLWQRQEEEHLARIASIRARLEQSAHSGEPVLLDAAFEKLEQLHQQRISTPDCEKL
jgi:antitoxin ParD1/3/4